MAITIMPISDLRRSLAVTVSKLTRPVYITQHGRVKAVLVDIDRYNALLDELEDARDIRDPRYAELEKEGWAAHERGETVPLEDALRKHGL